MDKKTARKKMIEMWSWMREHEDHNKMMYCRDIDKSLKTIKNRCPACEVANTIKDTKLMMSCLDCPIKAWSGSTILTGRFNPPCDWDYLDLDERKMMDAPPMHLNFYHKWRYIQARNHPIYNPRYKQDSKRIRIYATEILKLALAKYNWE